MYDIYIKYLQYKMSPVCEDDVHADCERRVAQGGCHGACGDGGRFPGDPYRWNLSHCVEFLNFDIKQEINTK